MSDDRKKLGDIGETIACRYLEGLGWEILATKWRCQGGELDIVARDGKTIVFIEVRTRRGKAAKELALASVDDYKKKRLFSLVESYCLITNLPEDTVTRLDLIAVGVEADGLFSIERVEDALSW
jgi:putative endonuclease